MKILLIIDHPDKEEALSQIVTLLAKDVGINGDLKAFIYEKFSSNELKLDNGIYILEMTRTNIDEFLHYAKQIRENDINGYIIVIADAPISMDFLFKEKLQILDFIISDDIVEIQDRLFDCFIFIRNIEYGESRKIFVETESKLIPLEIKHIERIEKKNVDEYIIKTKNKTYRYRGNINDFGYEIKRLMR